jgi:CubicO group peptidase (beta-lactamase class C family)
MRRRSLTLASLSLLLILCPSPSPATNATNDLFPAPVARQLDTQLAVIVRRYNLPSAAVAVEVPGKGRYTFVDGFANLQTRLPRALDQPFRIASVTKPFAATPRRDGSMTRRSSTHR